MNSDLKDTIEYLERLEGVLFEARKIHAVLTAIDEFRVTRSPKERADQRPNEHRMLLAVHDGFFDVAYSAMKRDLQMQVAKLLVKDRQSLHAEQIVEFANERSESVQRALGQYEIGPDDWSDTSYYKTFYRPMSDADRLTLRHDLLKYEPLIWKLANIRHKRLSHEDKQSYTPEGLTLDELQELMDLASRLLKSIRRTLGTTSKDFPHRFEAHKVDTKFMLDRLMETY